jgi:hypothetical protein
MVLVRYRLSRCELAWSIFNYRYDRSLYLLSRCLRWWCSWRLAQIQQCMPILWILLSHKDSCPFRSYCCIWCIVKHLFEKRLWRPLPVLAIIFTNHSRTLFFAKYHWIATLEHFATHKPIFIKRPGNPAGICRIFVIVNFIIIIATLRAPSTTFHVYLFILGLNVWN